MCSTVTPAPAGPRGTHCAILQPLLEAVPAGRRLCHRTAAVTAALCQDPAHQHLLQLRVVLPVDLLLHLPAQPVRRAPVCHADGRGDLQGRDPISGSGGTGAPKMGWRGPRDLGVAEPHPAWTSGAEPYHPCQALPGLCPLPAQLAGSGHWVCAHPRGNCSLGRMGSAAIPLCPTGLPSEHPHPTARPCCRARTWQAPGAGWSLFVELARLLGPGARSGTGAGARGQGRWRQCPHPGGAAGLHPWPGAVCAKVQLERCHSCWR